MADTAQPNANSFTKDTQAFSKAWAAAGSPQLYAELNEKTNSFSVTYTDANHHFHKLAVPALEQSVPSANFNANTIAPGDYQFGGGPGFYDGGAGVDTQNKKGEWADKNNQHAYGRADIPIRNADGTDGIPAINKHDGKPYTATGVEVHGGGSNLLKDGPQAPFAAKQKLLPTMGCVRIENSDATALANMVIDSGGSIPMRVTDSPTSILRSTNDGKGNVSDWKPMPFGADSPGTVTVKGDVVVQTQARGASAEFPLSQLKAAGFDPEHAQGVMHIGLDKKGEPYVLDDKAYKEQQRDRAPAVAR